VLSSALCLPPLNPLCPRVRWVEGRHCCRQRGNGNRLHKLHLLTSRSNPAVDFSQEGAGPARQGTRKALKAVSFVREPQDAARRFDRDVRCWPPVGGRPPREREHMDINMVQDDRPTGPDLARFHGRDGNSLRTRHRRRGTPDWRWRQLSPRATDARRHARCTHVRKITAAVPAPLRTLSCTARASSLLRSNHQGRALPRGPLGLGVGAKKVHRQAKWQHCKAPV
jgi:hypothetical protein